MAQDRKGKQEKPKPPNRGQRRRRQWIIAGGIIGIAAAAVGYFAYRAVAELPGTYVADLGNTHIQTFGEPHAAYNSDPPTSGPHMPYIAPWGIHTEPVPKELQVHNLEDKGVMVQYNCPSGCPDLVEKLKAIVQAYKDEVILAPYPGDRKSTRLNSSH